MPDSACTGTAIFTGVKAPYYTLGVDAHAKHGDCIETQKYKNYFPESIMSHAQKANMLTGEIKSENGKKKWLRLKKKRRYF